MQHLIVLQQLLPLLRFDGYYVLSDLTGVPDILSRIKPIFRSLVRGRRNEPRVAELKPWVRVVVTAYLLALVPAAGVHVRRGSCCRRRASFATVYDSFGLQLDRIRAVARLRRDRRRRVPASPRSCCRSRRMSLSLVAHRADGGARASPAGRAGACCARGVAVGGVAAVAVGAIGVRLVAERRLRADPARRARHHRRGDQERPGDPLRPAVVHARAARSAIGSEPTVRERPRAGSAAPHDGEDGDGDGGTGMTSPIPAPPTTRPGGEDFDSTGGNRPDGAEETTDPLRRRPTPGRTATSPDPTADRDAGPGVRTRARRRLLATHHPAPDRDGDAHPDSRRRRRRATPTPTTTPTRHRARPTPQTDRAREPHRDAGRREQPPTADPTPLPTP